jgi:hypothetical protein
VIGLGNIIRNNQVVSTGGATDNVYGILARGSGARVLNNDVIETRAQSGHFALGIEVYNGDGAVVEKNRVGNSSLGPGISYGIIVYPPYTNALVSDDCVTIMDHGVAYYGSPSTGKYRDNLTSGVTFPYEGGTDAGGNN